MEDDTEPEWYKPANENIGPHSEPDAKKPSAEIYGKIDRVALTLARIIGRRMAREDFERLHAANDNRPIISEGTEDEADRD